MLKETSRDKVLVINSITVTTVVTWVKFEKIGGSESPSSSGCGQKRVPLPHAEGGPSGIRTQSMFGYDSHRITILVRSLIFL
jgi:hypothetical protein